MHASTRAAAQNNAEWCDTLCRTHGARTTFDEHAWTSRTRTPPYYPDAVTLVPSLSIPDLLDRIDASAGCSIKDSFATLDLSAHGFRVLFAAEWIVRASTALRISAADPPWEVVRDADGLAAWEEAWRGDDGPSGLFRPELLDDDSVFVVAARSKTAVIGGAVLNRSQDVVGVSNVFDRSRDGATGWRGCLGLADRLFPGSTLVGYESGAALDVARGHGFTTAGPLRVWVRD